MLTTQEKFSRLLKKHKEYNREVYNFIYEALDYTLRSIVKTNAKNQHVSAEELSEGFRLHAINQFGCLAKTVLNEWGIRTTEDIGNIVFHLVEYDLMGKQDNEKRKNFRNLYDFNKAFTLNPKFSYNYETKEWQVSYV